MNEPATFVKKPIAIQAMQWDGTQESASAIIRWVHKGLPPESNAIVVSDGYQLRVRTLEGQVACYPKSWIIKGIAGEFYPCDPDIFEKTYSPA